MLCESPLIMHGLPVGCSRCENCKVNGRRKWTGRLMMESIYHERASMVTLTYSPDTVPTLDRPNSDGEFLQTLRKSDVQKFLKRLRWLISVDDNYRHFAGFRCAYSGEYGDIGQRPHYHLALFGLDANDREIIELAWSIGGTPIGHIDFQELNETTMHYVAGYIMKKMTFKDDARLDGRAPEFWQGRMVPAMGSRYVDDVLRLNPEWLIDEDGDVISEIKVGRSRYPIGRTLQGKLRIKLGVGDGSGKAPPAKLQRLRSEMLALCEDTALDASDWKVLDSSRSRKSRADQVLQRKLLVASRQKARNASERRKLQKQKSKPVERDLCNETL